MTRDPFYNQVVQRLSGPLDPEMFEHCANDLLRQVYPSLTPIRGGDDAGMDGAIADGQGLPIPLVCTTAKDVIGNLRKNLESYVKNGCTSRRVVLATSQQLTPKKRQNLEAAATKLGFTLINIHDRAAFADLLYRDPKWCRELLNLPGNPPPLSALPLSTRPLVNETLIGRDNDLKWLRGTHGDLLLVGQPGSGKTFSLHALAKEGGGLFVVTEDREQVAAGIRSQNPTALFVDDAHMHADMITRLRHLRDEIGASFRIIATCWTGEGDKVVRCLHVAGASIHELCLLTRDEMVEVIKGAGIGGPEALIREIVDQADGRPGLAVTLCRICLAGEVKEVVLGNILSRDVKETFGPLVGEDAITTLAAFAVGGDRGMPVKVVANCLGMPLVDLHRIVTGLAAGGVIADVAGQTLSVRPAQLRFALIRDTFFSGATSLPVNALIERAPSLSDVTETLLGAAHRGAKVPDDLLKPLVERSRSEEAWQAFAALGKTQVNWILTRHPELTLTVARVALDTAPRKIIPLLLARAVDDGRELHSYPDHPLRIIGDWIRSAWPGTGEALRRRQALLHSASEWVGKGGDIDVFVRVIPSILCPDFEGHSSDPGSGMTFTIKWAVLTQEEMVSVQQLWQPILSILKDCKPKNWEPIFDTMRAWMHPGRGHVATLQDVADAGQAFALRVMQDVLPMFEGQLGLLHHAKALIMELGVDLNIPLDPEFETLFLVTEGANWEKEQEQGKRAAGALAERWSGEAPSRIAKKLAHFECEARNTELHGQDWMFFACRSIVEQVDDPLTWTQAFADAGVSGKCITPFLLKAASKGAKGWTDTALNFLNREELQLTAVNVILVAPSVPTELLKAALPAMQEYPDSIYLWCIRNEVPEGNLRWLLRCADRRVALAASLGEWEADPRGQPRDSLADIWQTAMIQSFKGPLHPSQQMQWSLGRLLERDSAVAMEWIRARLGKNIEPFSPDEEKLGISAIKGLTVDQRQKVIPMVSDGWTPKLVQHIIGDNKERYKLLLAQKIPEYLHLAPLKGNMEGNWTEMAALALDAGYSPESVAESPYGGEWEWMVNESSMWTGWISRFERLLAHSDSRIREVGQIGRDRAKDRREPALAREGEEAVHGLRFR